MADNQMLPNGIGEPEEKRKKKLAALWSFLFRTPKRRLITIAALVLALLIGVGTPILVLQLSGTEIEYEYVNKKIPLTPDDKGNNDGDDSTPDDPDNGGNGMPDGNNNPTNPDEEPDYNPGDLNDPETDDKKDEDNKPIDILPDGSMVYDVNDYKDITQGVPKLKLTIQNDVTEKAKQLVVKISEEGKEYKFQKGDCLEYDVYISGSSRGVGVVDLFAAGGTVRLRDQQEAYDQNGVLLLANYAGWRQNSADQMTDFAANRWYHRSIKIPDGLVGKPLTYWALVSENNADGECSISYYDNIQLTNGKGSVKYTAYANGNLKKSEVVRQVGVKKYALDPELVFPRVVSAKGDAFEVKMENTALASGTRAAAEIKFSEAGKGKYSLCDGDAILYKIKNMNPLVAGGVVDIRFTDGTYMSDYGVLDQNGYAVKPTADISGISYRDWLYRKITVKGNLIGKVIDYWCVRVDNAAAGESVSIMAADVKVIRGETTQVLAFGGGSIDVAEVINESNTSVLFQKHLSSANSAKPAGNILQVMMAAPLTTSMTSYTSIWKGSYVIKEGDCLEYDLRADDRSAPAGGFGIDIVLEGGNSVRYGLEDQNAYPAGAGLDNSKYTSNRWYHRRIDLSSLAGEKIERLNIGGSVWMEKWYIYAYFDNIRVTNRNEPTLDAFVDNAPAINEIYNQANIAVSVVSTVPYELKPVNALAPTTLSTKDVAIMTFNVKDFGAKGDGVTDDTDSFQAALFAAWRLGGGIVFAPAGNYAIKQYLYIPRSVTLRGDWQNPESGGSGKGTILYASYGKGTEDGFAFISMSGGSALTNISVFYPEQSATNVQKYPWTVRAVEGLTITLENVTLYNPYRAVHYGPKQTHHQYTKNLYATPLVQGIEINLNYDMTRYNNINFKPSVWQNSKLPGAPASGAALDALKAFMGSNCTGFSIGRIDGLAMYDIKMSNMKTGIWFGDSDMIDPAQEKVGGAMGQITRLFIDEVRTGIQVDNLNGIGVFVTDGEIKASGGAQAAAVRTSSTMVQGISFQGVLMQSTGSIAVLEGGARVSFQNCIFNSWGTSAALDVRKGLVNVEGCDFKQAGKDINLAATCTGGVIAGNKYNGAAQITNSTPSSAKLALDTTTAKTFNDFGELAIFKSVATPKPANNKLFVIDSDQYGDGKTEAGDVIRKALSDAQAAGGGTIYLPAGTYKVTGRLIVPSGVELTGATTTAVHTEYSPTVIQIFDGRGNAGGEAFITLKKNAGVSGLAFHHYNQTIWDIQPYPYVIRGEAEGVYVRNVSFINAYQCVDFGTNNCNKHYIENVNGVALKVGIFVGGNAASGTIDTTHFNPHYWFNYRSYGTLTQAPGIFGDALVNYQFDNTTFFVFGDLGAENALLLFTFTGNTGMRFIDQGNGGANINFVNPMIDGPTTNIDIRQAKKINMVTPYFYVHHFMPTVRSMIRARSTFTGEINLFNGGGGENGLPSHSFYIENGAVNITQFQIPTGAEQYTVFAKGGKIRIDNMFTNPPYPGWKTVTFPLELYATDAVESIEINGWSTVGYAFKQLGDCADGKIIKNWIVDNATK